MARSVAGKEPQGKPISRALRALVVVSGLCQVASSRNPGKSGRAAGGFLRQSAASTATDREFRVPEAHRAGDHGGRGLRASGFSPGGPGPPHPPETGVRNPTSSSFTSPFIPGDFRVPACSLYLTSVGLLAGQRRPRLIAVPVLTAGGADAGPTGSSGSVLVIS